MPKLKLASLKNPRKSIVGGDWVTYPFWRAPDGSTPVRFNVSGTSTEAFVIAQEELTAEFIKTYKNERVPDDVRFQRNAELVAEHLLHGWEGLDDEYDRDLAEKLLPDRDFAALSNAVMWCANERENVKTEFIEDGIKNSEPPSGTN